MADPTIEITDSSDVPIVAGAVHDFGDPVPGSPPASVLRRVWNGRTGGAVDTARNIKVQALARLEGDSEWLGEGIELIDQLAVRVRSSNVPDLAGWVPAGADAWIPLPDLPDGSYWELEVQPDIPAGLPEAAVEFKLSVVFQRSTPVGDPLSVEQGIERGVALGNVSAILTRSAAWSTTGTATLTHPTYAAYLAGRPIQELGDATSGQETISQVDGDAAAMSAGEEYLFIVVITTAGRLVHKGSKGTGLSYPDDAPAVVAGDLGPVGWGRRYADVDATSMDWTSLDTGRPEFFAVEVVSGINVLSRPGLGVAGGYRVEPSSPSSDEEMTLTDDATNLVQRLPDGGIDSTTDGSLVQPGALILEEMVAASGAVTSRVDLRRWRGGIPIVAQFWNVSGVGATTWEWPWSNTVGRRLYLRPDSVYGFLDSIGGGWTNGAATFEIYTREPGSAEVTMFTSKGSDDQRPTIAWDASTPVAQGLPEVLVLEPGASAVFKCIISGDVDPNWVSFATVWD